MVDKKEDKVSRIVTYLANMEINEEVKPTPLSKELKMHPDTLRSKLDEWQTFIEAGKIEIIRDKNKKIKTIKKVKDENRDLNFKKEIRDLLVNLSNKIDETTEDVAEIKKKMEKLTKKR